jgi:RimJ/RimL family protein N-acetyltransferase
VTITLHEVSKYPEKYHYSLDIHGEDFTLRPLEGKDLDNLTNLIEVLSETTKKFYSYESPSSTIAQELCDAIAKYDKLRFVLEKDDPKELIGLFEFSMDIPDSDHERFNSYGITLSENDCRIGPLLKDDYQAKGVGSKVQPVLISIARLFGRNRIILWGGVRQDNSRAIKFYERNGFKNVGSFVNETNDKCYDMILEL